jgi:hypothetical protein
MAFAPPKWALADRVEELSSALIHDRSDRVRVQAAVVLGKLKDERAVPALARALSDRVQAVRGVAIDALVAIGGDEARRALQTRRSDDAGFVRDRLRAANAKLQKPAALHVEIGGVGAKVTVSPALQKRLRTFIERELERSPGVTMEGSRESGFLIDSSITSMTKRNAGSLVEISCEVSYVVGRLPSKAMVMMTSGGATVQVSRSSLQPSTELAVESDALENAVHGAHANLLAFLKSQQ